MGGPKAKEISLFDRKILVEALVMSFKKLAPQHMIKNPVMFVVEVGSVLTTMLWLRDMFRPTTAAARSGSPATSRCGCGSRCCLPILPKPLPKGAAGLRPPRCAKCAKTRWPAAWCRGREEQVAASALVKGDSVVVEANQLIPGDGEIIEGIASVDESAITGESAPVIRESGGDRSAVTGGTKVLQRSDRGAALRPTLASRSWIG